MAGPSMRAAQLRVAAAAAAAHHRPEGAGRAAAAHRGGPRGGPCPALRAALHAAAPDGSGGCAAHPSPPLPTQLCM